MSSDDDHEGAADRDLDVRRPDLRDALRLGTVRWWKEDKGYGRITADDGEVLFAHFSAIVKKGYRALEEGQRVSFVWRGSVGDHGRHAAEEVRVIGERQPGPDVDPGGSEGVGRW